MTLEEKRAYWRVQAKKYYIRNKAKKLAAVKKYQNENYEKVLAYVKKWQGTHPCKISSIQKTNEKIQSGVIYSPNILITHHD